MEVSNFTFAKNLYHLGNSIGSSIKKNLFDPPCSSSVFTSILNKETFWKCVNNVRQFPHRYRIWWIKLLKEDPVHVLIETLLLAFVVYLLLFTQINNSGTKTARRKKRGKGDANNNADVELLTEAEKDELIREWKPAPLAPPLSPDCSAVQADAVVIHKVNGTQLTIQDGFCSSTDSESSSSPTTRLVLNMASYDFLGMGAANQHMKEASKAALTTYGCGSCGPRGFYGTVDVHLDLERQISKFCQTDDAIMYSDGASAATSAVAAFAKRGDLLVVDEGVYEALQTGVTLSRANVVYFKHNDMNDLRRVLQEIHATDIKLGRMASEQRRFIVVEGLYKNFGHICPIDELVAIKRQYCYRLIVDESFSFGTLGTTGKGAIELYGKKITEDVEIVIISLENSLASIGGMCVGDMEVVDHQRLSGAGYCFSASAPPFVAVAAMESLAKIKQCPEIFLTLNENRRALYQGLRDIQLLEVTSDERSSIVFIRLAERSTLSEKEEEQILARIARRCLEEGVLVVSAAVGYDFLHRRPPPSLKMTITAAHTNGDIQKTLKILSKVAADVLV